MLLTECKAVSSECLSYIILALLLLSTVSHIRGMRDPQHEEVQAAIDHLCSGYS